MCACVVAAIPTEAPATQAPEPSKEAETGTSSALSQDAVAGIVIGVIGGLLLVVLIAMYIYDRRTDIHHTAPPPAAASATASAAAGGRGDPTTPPPTPDKTSSAAQDIAPADAASSSEA